MQCIRLPTRRMVTQSHLRTGTLLLLVAWVVVYGNVPISSVLRAIVSCDLISHDIMSGYSRLHFGLSAVEPVDVPPRMPGNELFPTPQGGKFETSKRDCPQQRPPDVSSLYRKCSKHRILVGVCNVIVLVENNIFIVRMARNDSRIDRPKLPIF